MQTATDTFHDTALARARLAYRLTMEEGVPWADAQALAAAVVEDASRTADADASAERHRTRRGF
jgi:hypothetical protein